MLYWASRQLYIHHNVIYVAVELHTGHQFMTVTDQNNEKKEVGT